MRIVFLINAGLWLVLLVIFTTTSLPGNTLFWNEMQNAGHGLVMCIAAFMSISTTIWKFPQHTLKTFIVVPVALLALGVLIELLQHLSGRGASIHDVILDATGIAAGMCFSTLFIHHLKRSLKLLCVFVGILFIAWCIHKPTYLLTEKWLSPALPVLANFDHPAADARIRHRGITYSIGNHQDVWPSSEGQSLKIHFPPIKLAYIRFLEPPRDWSNYNNLSVDVFNSEDSDVKLAIRLHYDPDVGVSQAYMVARLTVQPGHTKIELTYDDIAQEFSGNEPDFTKVTQIMLYIPNATESATLYFDNLTLY